MTSPGIPPQSNPFAPPETNVDDVLHLRGNSLQVEYDMRRLDYLIFMLSHQFRMASLQFFYVALSVFFAFMVMDLGVLEAILAGLLLYIGQWCLQTLFMFVVVLTSRNPRLYTRHLIEAGADAFLVSTKYAQQRYYWFGIEKVHASPWFTAVYINVHTAHVIPRRAFPDRRARDEFVKLVFAQRMASPSAGQA